MLKSRINFYFFLQSASACPGHSNIWTLVLVLLCVFPSGDSLCKLNGRGQGATLWEGQTQSLLWWVQCWVHHVSHAVRSVLSSERDFVLCGEAGLGGLLKVELLEAVECRGESESWKTKAKKYCNNRCYVQSLGILESSYYNHLALKFSFKNTQEKDDRHMKPLITLSFASLGSVRCIAFESLFCSPRLHLFDRKYS